MKDDAKYEALIRLQEGLYGEEPILPATVGISEDDARMMASEGLIGLGCNAHVTEDGGTILAEILPKGMIFLSTHSRQASKSAEIRSTLVSMLWDVAKILLVFSLGYLLGKSQ